MSLTAIVAYGGHILGEAPHVSGILCVVGAGIVVGNYGRSRDMSERTQAAVSQLWDYVAFVLNSLVFVLIGATVPLATLAGHLGLVAAGAGIVLLARAAMVYGVLSLRPAAGPPDLLALAARPGLGRNARSGGGRLGSETADQRPQHPQHQGARLRRRVQHPGDPGHHDPSGGQVPPAPCRPPR
jgi:hypothetical protein